MASDADIIVVRARVCIGARFRLHGRLVETGLDCVGVAALAYGRERVPSNYALRGGDVAAVIAAIEALGFVATEDLAPGNLLLLAPGPYQHHLAILTPGGFVHADAGLRRVVETPGEPRWPLVAAWRAQSINEG